MLAEHRPGCVAQRSKRDQLQQSYDGPQRCSGARNGIVVSSVVDFLVAGHIGDTSEIIRFEELDGHAVVTTPLRAGYEGCFHCCPFIHRGPSEPALRE